MVGKLQSQVSRLCLFLFDRTPRAERQEPDLTRRWVLSGAAAVLACGLVAGLPTPAEADSHGRRRSRRHGRRRSRDDHGRRRSRRHGRRRSRDMRDDYDDERCYFIGPVVICED